MLLNHLLKEKVFNQLRTIEQLGYLVSCKIQLINKVVLFTIAVQSSKQSATFLEHRVNNFL